MLLITTKDRPIADDGDDEDDGIMPMMFKEISVLKKVFFTLVKNRCVIHTSSNFPLIETANPGALEICVIIEHCWSR